MAALRSRLPPLLALAPFEAACRHASFSKAAAELSLTQAAVSRQIRLLEQRLGIALFERRRHGVVVTAAGMEFLGQVAPALNAVAAAADRARHAGRAQASLTIFSDLALAGSFIIPRLGSLKRLHPDLDFRLVTSSEPMETATEPFDVGLTTAKVPEELFERVPICGEEIFPVASPAFRRRLPRKPTIDDVARAPLLHFSQPDRGWMDWRAFLAAHGVPAPRPRHQLTFTSYSVLLDAAEAGHGIALGWKLSVENRLREGALLRLAEFSLPLEQGLTACLPRQATPSPAAQRFLDWLKCSV
ncbi:MAG: LysR substrate-binding domain-containing protein [Dongiaceae bacterium]